MPDTVKKIALPNSQPGASTGSPAERNMAALLREIENDSLLQPLVLPEPATHKADHLLRAFILTDAVALTVSFILAWGLAAWVNSALLHRAPLTPDANSVWLLILQFVAIASGIVFWFGYTNHYQARLPFWIETRKIVETTGFAMLAACFLQVATKQDFSRLWMVSCCVFAVVLISAFRCQWRSAMRRRGLWQIATVLIGRGNTADEARSVLKMESNLGYHIVAEIKDLSTAYKLAGFSWQMLCRKYGADHVIVALDGEDLASARPALQQLTREQIPFAVAPPVHSLSVVGAVRHTFLGRDVVLLTRNSGLDRPLYRFFKRGFDILISGSALLILSPVIGVLALIVRRDGGKAFYGHKRIGLNGGVFSCLKLRSMIAQSDAVLAKHLQENPEARAEWQRDHKLRDDPRVTVIGALLRRTSFDELPQLINVLKGEMSIVGPRPIIVAETMKYDNDIAFYYRVRPGITGLWQVSGRNDVTYAERVRMDSWYVRNWSLWNDIAIICKTFGVVFKRDGAY